MFRIFRFIGLICTVFKGFAACPGMIRMFRIFCGLNMRKLGMTGFVGDGSGRNPLYIPPPPPSFWPETFLRGRGEAPEHPRAHRVLTGAAVTGRQLDFSLGVLQTSSSKQQN